MAANRKTTPENQLASRFSGVVFTLLYHAHKKSWLTFTLPTIKVSLK